MPINFAGNLRQATLALALGLTLLPSAWRIAPFAARHAAPLCGVAVAVLVVTGKTYWTNIKKVTKSAIQKIKDVAP